MSIWVKPNRLKIFPSLANAILDGCVENEQDSLIYVPTGLGH
jgi:hypothetical protein